MVDGQWNFPVSPLVHRHCQAALWNLRLFLCELTISGLTISGEGDAMAPVLEAS